MYCNELSKENDKDIDDKNQFNLDLFFQHEKKYRFKRISEDMAHYTMLWFKYYRGDNTDYYSLANSSTGEIKFNYDEWNTIIENSKEVLQEKYKIILVSCNPLILGSSVPFSAINEE